MTEKEMAQEIGELALKYKVRVMALEAQVRQLSRELGQQNPAFWGDGIEDTEDAFDNPPYSRLWRDNCDQLRQAFDEATPDVPLIHVLRQSLLGGRACLI
jgi:hypothetical protein